MRPLIILVPLLLPAAGCAQAGPLAYPDKPVRVIVTTAPGRQADRVAHLIVPLLGTHFGQRFIVDNRTGADGLLGTELAARATADGCTLLVGMPATLTTTAYRRLHPAYDTRKDFAPIGLVAASAFVVATHPAVPAAGLQDLIALARSDRSRLAFGIAREPDTARVAIEHMQSVARIDLGERRFPARAELVGRLLAGEVAVGMLEVRHALEHVRARRLRALAVTSARRSAALPNVPTVAESGLPGFEATKWTGLLAPARTPPDVVAELAVGLRRALANPGVRWQLAQDGLQPGDGESEAFRALLAREIAEYGRLAKPLPLRWR